LSSSLRTDVRGVLKTATRMADSTPLKRRPYHGGIPTGRKAKSAAGDVTAIRSGAVTPAEVAEAFLPSPRAAIPNTRRGYVGVIDRHAAELGPHRQLAAVPGDEIAAALRRSGTIARLDDAEPQLDRRACQHWMAARPVIRTPKNRYIHADSPRRPSRLSALLSAPRCLTASWGHAACPRRLYYTRYYTGTPSA
jgi:hypothetical protein